MLGQISIPAAHVRAPIVRGVAARDLAHGAGHYPGTCWPGQGCTVVLAGHDVTFVPQAEGGHVFNRLAQHPYPGAKVYIRFHRHTYRYVLRRWIVVPPTFSRFLWNLRPDRLILTTCFPPGSARSRLVWFATPDW